jgi:hypothetical protein
MRQGNCFSFIQKANNLGQDRAKDEKEKKREKKKTNHLLERAIYVREVIRQRFPSADTA